MPWSIKNCIPYILSLKCRHTYFNCLSSCFLIIIRIHDIRKPPRLSFLLLSNLLILLDLLSGKLATQLHQLSYRCTLSWVYMPDKYKSCWSSLSVNLCPLILVLKFLDCDFIDFFNHLLLLFHIFHCRVKERLYLFLFLIVLFDELNFFFLDLFCLSFSLDFIFNLLSHLLQSELWVILKISFSELCMLPKLSKRRHYFKRSHYK